MKRPMPQKLQALDALLPPMLQAFRVPGAALAIVADGEVVFAKGYGCRDLNERLPVTPDTIYPIASTTKAMTATLIGMLVDERRLAWDAPVQSYLPDFQLGDAFISSRVTLRDLITMRTGLPRHDWTWLDNPVERSDLTARLRYLELSAGFRERYQYNNLTVTVAGHIAERVTGRTWEELMCERLFEPLRMRNTHFAQPRVGNATHSYHENSRREIVTTQRMATEVTGPSGGSVHSSVLDMTRWLRFNLEQGRTDSGSLISTETLGEIRAPQVVAGTEPSAPTPHAAYGLGWFVYSHNGNECVSHGGYLHDVASDVMFFPSARLGFVCFTNLGCPLPRLLNHHAYDVLMDLGHVRTLEDELAGYERKIALAQDRVRSVPRVGKTCPSHDLADYEGDYVHPGYGGISFSREADRLVFRRNRLALPLRHWHYDAWVAGDTELFPAHLPNVFAPVNRFLFETDMDGRIASVCIGLEPAVAPVRFGRVRRERPA